MRALFDRGTGSWGTSPAQWAREHGGDGRSLDAWRVNLGHRQPVGSARFTPIELSLTQSDRATIKNTEGINKATTRSRDDGASRGSCDEV